jgi:DNA repair exonuclease SbcCD ATPase subunit
MNNAKKIAEEIEKVTEGIQRVPVVENPPHIKWGEGFNEWEDDKKLSYLMKFAESMNHAADTIQNERNALGKLLEKKEKQIIQMKARLEANDRMLQSQMTEMNTYKQKTNANVMKLNARIRELERGDTG